MPLQIQSEADIRYRASAYFTPLFELFTPDNGEPSSARWLYWSRMKDVSFWFFLNIASKIKTVKLFIQDQTSHLTVNDPHLLYCFYGFEIKTAQSDIQALFKIMVSSKTEKNPKHFFLEWFRNGIGANSRSLVVNTRKTL